MLRGMLKEIMMTQGTKTVTYDTVANDLAGIALDCLADIRTINPQQIINEVSK